MALVERGQLGGVCVNSGCTPTKTMVASARPSSETWTFSSTGDRRVAWWNRRLAVELAIDRWHAEHTAAADGGPPPSPLDCDVAAAGIEEFMIEFLPGLLALETTGQLSGTLHLPPTDRPSGGSISMRSARPCPGTPRRTAIRGTRSDLLLWLTNRSSPGSMEVFGRRELLDSWMQLRR